MSAEFTGIFEHGIDDKGRVIIPMKLRDAVDEEKEGAGFVMSFGLDRCIFMYTPRGWNAFKKRVPGTELNARRRKFIRMIYGGARRGRCDRQGRIIIPDPLKRYAEIDKEVVIVGAEEHIEIWAKEKWEKEFAESMEMFEDNADQLSGGGGESEMEL